MALSLKQFVQQLEDSGILAGDTLKDFIPPKASPKDVSELARELIRQKKLTKYQAEEVYRGKAKSLVLGNYVLIEKIGAGGMGLVFKAEHRRMHRTVAIKLLPPHMTKDAAAIARFEREVTAAAKLRHSNIVAADDADCANGVHFLVMEMVEGNDLSALVKKNGPFSVEKAVNYVLQAAKGLEFAHHEGVVHRDIKPANLLLDKKGVVKILDMGLARLNGDGNVDTPKQAELTSTGMVMGTVDYMAPEQALNTKMADARADIYALGCSLYYLLTGKATYDGDSLMAKLLAHRDQTIPSLRAVRSEVPEQVEAVFKKMVAKTVQDRYQTMTEVIVELERCTTSPTTSVTIQQSATTTFEDGTFDCLKKPLDEPSILAKSAEKSTSGKSGNSKNTLFQPEITISDILKKITNPKVMAVAAIIALMFSGLFLIWSMKSGTKVKGIIKTQGAELVKLNLDLEEIEVLGKGIKLDLVLIPAGKFVMSMLYEGQHEVTLTKPYYMGKYEVTQEQWEGVMGNNPSIETKGAKLPVTDVSWEDCQEFIKKLNAKTSGGYRLPTEAEWEYACRAGTTTHYSFGANLSPLDANYDESKIGKPVTVGSYKPNAFGLYDMHGNVREWCEDWLADFPAGAATDPKGPATGVQRVLHGGHFNENFGGMQIGYRHQGTPTTRNDIYGFRLARTADIEAAVAEPAVPKSDPAGVIPAGNLLVAPFTEAKAKEVQKASAKSLQKEVEEKVDLGKGINLDLVLIPAGKFMMGSPAAEVGRVANETQHEVTFTKPFYMGKYEVTQEQYEAVMGNNPSSTKGGKLPVTDVSWEDCQEFITKLNAKPDGRYRLPTEAEWEYACRAGTTTSYSFGDKITPQDANYEDSKIGKPVAVGSYKPNAFGLYDLCGNVWEWCEDWYGDGDYPEGSAIDPKGQLGGSRRVLRGGSFHDDGSVARSSIRHAILTMRPFYDGFRLARTVKVTLAFETPGFDKWLKEVAAMPAEQQIEVVVKKLQELNPKFDGKFSGVGDLLIKEGVVAGFSFCTNFVTDISPIRAFTHLKQLDCLGAVFDGQDGQLSDLAPLKGMELLSLNFSYNQVTDITPLMGMPLVSLSCYYNPISNLSPLRNMQLEHFHLEGTKVADLSPLRGMTKLRAIWLGRTKVTDLSVLTGMPLQALWIFETQVTDLTPLRGMSLYSLSIRSSQVTDLSVLKDMPLSELQLDFTPERDTELLRSIKTLNTINSKPAADFWKEVDEKK